MDRIPNTCLVKADEPHLSTTARRNGYRSMVAKGWFICSVPLKDATIEFEMQRRSGDQWELLSARVPLTFGAVPVNKKREAAHEVGCDVGAYRARTRVTSHDAQGVFTESPWVHGRERTDPCGKEG